MWRAVIAGFRAIGARQGLKLLYGGAIIFAFALIVLVPRVRTVYAADNKYGDWMGTVSITKSIPQASLYPKLEQQGSAVIEVKVSPVWFSFLDRTAVRAVLIDQYGRRHILDVSGGLDRGWQLPVQWGAKELLAGTPDESLGGKWNFSFPDFDLTFEGSSSQIADLATYRLHGSLTRGDDATLQSLVRFLQTSH